MMLPSSRLGTDVAAAAIALLAASCAREPPQRAAAPASFVAAPAPSTAAEPAPKSCELLLARHRQRWQRTPEAPADCLAAVQPQPKTPDAPFACEATPRGTWALIAAHDVWRDWRGFDPHGSCLEPPDLRLSLVFRRDDLDVDIERPGFAVTHTVHGGETPYLMPPFDYDGDGNAEVVVRRSVDGEGDEWEIYEVYTVQGGVIAPYAPAAKLEIRGIEDGDGDGRPDLLIDAHQAETSSVGISGRHTAFPGIAHSLPGGHFVLDDLATRQFADAHCARLGHRGIVAFVDGGRDDVSTGHAIVCARRRGVSEQEIRSELAKHCTAFASQSDAEDPQRVPRDQPCPEWWNRWLERLR